MLLEQAEQFYTHEHPGVLIEGRERLIEEQYGRIGDQCSRHRDTLAHPP